MSGQDSTRRRDAAATRKALLNAATILFAERGFDRTTVRDIAVQAGANQALLFRYFGSKEAVFEEVIAGPGRELLAASKPQRLLVDCLHGMLSEESPDKHGSLKALLRSFDTDALIRHRCAHSTPTPLRRRPSTRNSATSTSTR